MTTNNGKQFSSVEIVKQYREFFLARKHVELPGSPLAVPGNSTSFIIAGMQPLLPYLRGQQQAPAPLLTMLQRCLRSDDSDMVGTNARKASFFHMLGNWSLNDYWKHEAIDMALELLLNVFGLDQSTLWVTIFAGDSELGIPFDDSAFEEWQRAGIPRGRIVPLGVDDNLWTMGGPGPCGPCTEIFVDRGQELSCGLPTCQPGCSCDRFLEVWNLVFMEYEQLPEGRLVALPQRNVDTGMGLERMASVLQDTESIFSIDLFQPALHSLEELAPTTGSSPLEKRARRMIVDHTRAALFAGLAGVEPGRDGRNSVVRRLIRRAARQGRVLGIHEPFLSKLIVPLVEAHTSLLTEQERSQVPAQVNIVAAEEKRFERVLTIGLRYLSQIEPDEQGVVSGEKLFTLHAEKGFPVDLATEVLADRGLTVDWSSYELAQQEHRRVSRISAERHFRNP